MGGKILLFFPLKKIKDLEGQREPIFPEKPNLSLQVKKKAPVVKLMLLI